jgi:GntR family transcriptional regulator
MYMTSGGGMALEERKYQEVKLGITDALRDGRWRHGQRIPSEPVLARRFGVSVGTVRRAVGELVAENILVREQGRGTFVVSHTRDYMLNVFFRIVDREGRKELHRGTVLEFERVKADRETARHLALSAGAAVIRIVTLLRLQDRPAIVDHIRLPARLFPNLTEQMFADRTGTVFGMFQARYGLTVVRTEEFITAVLADERHARLLELEPGAPLLHIRRTAYTYKDMPVETRVRYVSCAHHGYANTLGRT